ncbi:unnamed protein product, partial [Aphanomyces euteiches]
MERQEDKTPEERHSSHFPQFFSPQLLGREECEDFLQKDLWPHCAQHLEVVQIRK